MKLKYVEGFKYQLAKELIVCTGILGQSIIDDYFQLFPDGTLIVRKGYAWDGASGPTFDTKSSMRASLVHDALCQMMRDGRLSFTFQDQVNELFRQHCIEDGMWEWRAAIWHAAVEFANAGDPSQGPDRKVLEAP
jgi:hypothetical protein